MGKIWEFFDTLSEYVYVADMDTHDLVYMNQMALKAFGVSSPEEVRKHKCHALLQNCSAPCTICNNDNLRPGTFLKWSYYHTGLQKFLYLIDTMIEEEGHRYRLEIAIDISEPKQANADSHYLSLEMLINEGLRVALQQPTPDATLNFLLEYLGKLLKGDRSYIFEKNETGGDNNTYEWVAAGVTPEKEDLQDLTVATDNVNAGRMMGEYARTLLDKDSKIAIVSHVKGVSTAVEREQGFREGLGDYAENIVETVYCNSLYEKSYELAQKLMEKYPDLEMIAGMNEYSAVGVGRAVSDAGVKDRNDVVGVDCSQEAINLMEMGVYKGIIVQKAFRMGYIGVEETIHMLNGDAVEKNIDSGCELVTPENMYDSDIERLIFPFG